MRISGVTYVVAPTIAVLLLTGCGGSNLFSSPSVGQQNQSRIKHSTSSCPCLYVASGGASIGAAISVWAVGTSGNWEQIREISGSNTELSLPVGVAVDGQGSMYVANDRGTSITVYAAGATGNVAPIRRIRGKATGLHAVSGIAFDRHTDEIYVANESTNKTPDNSITIYPAHAHGNVSPVGVISGQATGLDYPTGPILDTHENIYVPNFGNNSVTVYAAGSTGNVTPTRTIAGSRTKLDPRDLAFDSSGNMYVANGPSGKVEGSVTVYKPRANGNVAPIDTISGSLTMLDDPVGIALDSSNNIYVANNGSRSKAAPITVYAAGSNGNVAPINVIRGPGMTFPNGVRILPL